MSYERRTFGRVLVVDPRDPEDGHDLFCNADASARVGGNVNARNPQLAGKLGRLEKQLSVRSPPTPPPCTQAQCTAHTHTCVSHTRRQRIAGSRHPSPAPRAPAPPTRPARGGWNRTRSSCGPNEPMMCVMSLAIKTAWRPAGYSGVQNSTIQATMPIEFDPAVSKQRPGRHEHLRGQPRNLIRHLPPRVPPRPSLRAPAADLADARLRAGSPFRPTPVPSP